MSSFFPESLPRFAFDNFKAFTQLTCTSLPGEGISEFCSIFPQFLEDSSFKSSHNMSIFSSSSSWSRDARKLNFSSSSTCLPLDFSGLWWWEVGEGECRQRGGDSINRGGGIGGGGREAEVFFCSGHKFVFLAFVIKRWEGYGGGWGGRYGC
ncbi:UNVERIFIED_CONTAM: hypothetical protein Sangu_2264400 [Sesamum angustifolium]|uniref:Uncharacterized protein n=1 Tax=Sesamum angustifolium TaxID=2727405 RepID=A0AAW2L7D3_9LAMI